MNPLNLHSEYIQYCRWGQAENCYSKAGADLVKPLQAAKLTTEGLFSFR